MIIIMSIIHWQRSGGFFFLSANSKYANILLSNKTGTFFAVTIIYDDFPSFHFSCLIISNLVSYELERIKVEARQTICIGFDELFVSFERNSRFPNIALISLPLITGKTLRFGKFSSFIDSVTVDMMWGII